MKYLCSLLCWLGLASIAFGQLNIPGTLDNLTVNDAAASTIQTEDCNYVMAGFWGPIAGMGPDSAFLMKLDPCGCALWLEKFYPPNGAGSAGFLDVIELANGELVAIGVAIVKDTLGVLPLGQVYEAQQIWTVRTTAQGDLIRSKTWGINEFPFSLAPTITGVPTSNGWAIIETSEGELALTGRALDVNTGNTFPLRLSDFLLQIDLDFNRQSWTVLPNQVGHLKWGLDLIELSDGDFMISGQSLDTLNQKAYVSVVRTQADGTVRYDSLYLESRGDAIHTGAYAMLEKPTGKVLLVGKELAPQRPMGDYDGFLMELEPGTGAQTGVLSFGLPNNDDGFLDIKPFKGGYWLGGISRDIAVGLKINDLYQPLDTLLAGYANYKTAFLSVLPVGNSDSVVLAGARYQANQGFDSTDVVMVNTAYDSVTCASVSSILSYGGGIIIQIDDINAILPGVCQALPPVTCEKLTLGSEGRMTPRLFHLYPNPSYGTLFLETSYQGPLELKCWDMTGRLVEIKGVWSNCGMHRISLSESLKGLFFLEITGKDIREVYRVWIK